MEYYIREAGHILGLRLPDEAGAKSVLSEVFKRISGWKMGGAELGHNNNTEGMVAGGGGGGGYDHFEL